MKEGLKTQSLRRLCEAHSGLFDAILTQGLYRCANDLDRANALSLAFRGPGETVDFKAFGERFRALGSATEQVEDLKFVFDLLGQNVGKPGGLRGDVSQLAAALKGLAEDVNRCRRSWGDSSATDAQSLASGVGRLVEGLKRHGFTTADGAQRAPSARELAAFEPYTKPAAWNRP